MLREHDVQMKLDGNTQSNVLIFCWLFLHINSSCVE